MYQKYSDHENVFYTLKCYTLCVLKGTSLLAVSLSLPCEAHAFLCVVGDSVGDLGLVGR